MIEQSNKQEPELHEVFSVSETNTEGVFTLDVDITDMNGERYTADYVSHPDDTFGLAPIIRAAVNQWIADGNHVEPYVPPTIEELRSWMPPLTRRQLLLGLAYVGITKQMVSDAINAMNDPLAVIEWEEASQFERTHPLVVDMIPVFDLVEDQVDSLWIWASEL